MIDSFYFPFPVDNAAILVNNVITVNKESVKMTKQVRLRHEANTNALRVASKVNSALASDGVEVSKQRVVEAATNAFYEECAKLEGKAFENWIVEMFKGEF